MSHEMARLFGDGSEEAESLKATDEALEKLIVKQEQSELVDLRLQNARMIAETVALKDSIGRLVEIAKEAGHTIRVKEIGDGCIRIEKECDEDVSGTCDCPKCKSHMAEHGCDGWTVLT